MIASRFSYCLLIALGLVLSACAQPRPTAKSVTDLPGYKTYNQEIGGSDGQQDSATQQSASLPQIEEPPIEVNENPDQFLGMTLPMINEKIGAPIFARRDGEVEVWQYRRTWQNGTCHLDLFLYPGATSSADLVVKYVDLRSQFLSREDQTACFAEILRDHIRHQRG